MAPHVNWHYYYFIFFVPPCVHFSIMELVSACKYNNLVSIFYILQSSFFHFLYMKLINVISFQSITVIFDFLLIINNYFKCFIKKE